MTQVRRICLGLRGPFGWQDTPWREEVAARTRADFHAGPTDLTAVKRGCQDVGYPVKE